MSHQTPLARMEDKNIPSRPSQPRSIRARPLKVIALFWFRFKRLVAAVASNLWAGVTWCGSHLSHWPWVAGLALTLIGIGANAMFGGYSATARILIYLGIGLLGCKAISEVRDHEKRPGVISVILFAGAVCVFTTESLIELVERNGRANPPTEISNPVAQLQPTPPPPLSPQPTVTALPSPSYPRPRPRPVTRPPTRQQVPRAVPCPPKDILLYGKCK